MPPKTRFPNYRQIPKPQQKQEFFKLKINELKPTQMCVGFSEVWSRQKEFSNETYEQRLEYLRSKPIPIVRTTENKLWMLDRHHRLKALIEIDKEAEGFGYLVEEINTQHESIVLDYLFRQGWLYLYDNRGRGPQSKQSLPKSLLELEDDPYRSLVWKLKKEGLILPQPLIPYHEFHWCSWLRTRALPPFNSKNLLPALSIARGLVSSGAAAHLDGWIGLQS